MKLGIHASVRKGFLSALADAAKLNCRAVQIFPRKPRAPVNFLSQAELTEFNQFRTQNSIEVLVTHSVFQPNIASSNHEVLERSRHSLLEEFQFVHQLESDFFVIHAGNYSADSDLKTGIRTCAQTIRMLLSINPRPSRGEGGGEGLKILIENVPGGARRIGGNFEELKAILEEIGEENRVGICFDTAHAFAAGYPIHTLTGMDDCIALLDRNLGLKSVELFHINDTLAEFGSHKDIHQHLGEGFIGLEPIKRLAQEKRFSEKTGIIETPKLPPDSDQKNLEIIS